MVTWRGGGGHGKIDDRTISRRAVPVFPAFRIRPAVAAEAAELTALCRRAKAHRGYPAEWLAAWADDLRVTPEEAASGRVFVAETAADGRVGFGGLSERAGRWWLEHLWVEPGRHGRGCGRTLFATALTEAQRRGVSELWIVADPQAEGFYRRLGARRVGTERGEVCGVARELPLLVVAVP